jgi:hypothetical protein
MAYPVAQMSADNGFPFVNVVNTKQVVNWTGIVIPASIIIASANPIYVPLQNTIWLLACRSVLSFAIVCDNFSAELQVELSVDGGTTFLQAFTFPISGEGIIDPVSDFPLSGSAGRFTLLCANGTTSSGWLEVRAF